MSDKERQYKNWVGRVIDFLSDVGPKIGRSCSVMQSRAVLDRDVEVVFLGCNADENYGYEAVSEERFYEGNPFFYNCDKHHHNDAMHYEPWKIWYKPYEGFRCLGDTSLMEEGNYVFMNSIYFGTKNLRQIDEISNIEKLKRQCLNYTEEVIHEVFKPKLVICFSVNACFDALDNQFEFENVETIYPVPGKTQYKMKTGDWKGIRVIGIPHPSQRISWVNMGLVCGEVLKLRKLET